MKRYRTTVKVFCDQCLLNIQQKKGIDTRCETCKWKRYTNVTNLLTFMGFLDNKFPDWVYCNCFEYVKGQNGKWLGSYQNKGKRPSSANEL